MHWIIKATIFSLFGTYLSFVFADDDSHRDKLSNSMGRDVAVVTDKVYLDECGACHFAYQPGWLPSQSWQKIMQPKALANHFGEHADMDDATRKHVLAVLENQSADKSNYKRARKIMKSLKSREAPIRITELPYIQYKHHELRDIHVQKNDQVRSLAYCNKCHPKASQGDFEEDAVVIPGLKKRQWDD